MAEAVRILIVSEAKDHRGLLEGTLTDAFAEVTCASSGAEALELATSTWFDIAFINTSLPDMDGVNLVRYLTEFRTGTIPIVMTTNRSHYSALAALEAGASRYLLLPFENLATPVRVVRETLAERVLLLRRRYSLRLVDLGRELHLLENEGRISPVRVVVVDPDDDGRLKFSNALRSAGCVVRNFSGAEQALTNLEPSEIIAMAYNMGDLKAVEALRKIRAWRGLVEVMIFGGEPSLDEIATYIRYGASAYIERHLDFADMTSYLLLRHGRATQVNKYVGSLERLNQLLPQIELGFFQKGAELELCRQPQKVSDVTRAHDNAEAGVASKERSSRSDVAKSDVARSDVASKHSSDGKADGESSIGRVSLSPGYYSKTPGTRRSSTQGRQKLPEKERKKKSRLRSSIGFYHINEPEE